MAFRWDYPNKRNFCKWLFFIIGICMLGVPKMFGFDILAWNPLIGFTIGQVLGALSLYAGFLLYRKEI